jgi:hypothetical protein
MSNATIIIIIIWNFFSNLVQEFYSHPCNFHIIHFSTYIFISSTNWSLFKSLCGPRIYKYYNLIFITKILTIKSLHKFFYVMLITLLHYNFFFISYFKHKITMNWSTISNQIYPFVKEKCRWSIMKYGELINFFFSLT